MRSKPKRKITLIEILVLVAIAAILARLVYQIIYWRDIVDKLSKFPLVGIVFIFILGAIYLANRWKNKAR